MDDGFVYFNGDDYVNGNGNKRNGKIPKTCTIDRLSAERFSYRRT